MNKKIPNQNLIENTKGFLDSDEGNYLFEIADKASKNGACLEIGSYCGKSTIYIGSACKNNKSILFSIDHHQGSEEQQPGEEYFDPDLFDKENNCIDTFKLFRKTLKKASLEDNVVPIVCKSKIASKMWKTPLTFVFIDGGHAYETVIADFNCWAKHIIKGGFLLIHDLFESPKDGGQAPFKVYVHALDSGMFEKYGRVKTLGVLKRT